MINYLRKNSFSRKPNLFNIFQGKKFISRSIVIFTISFSLTHNKHWTKCIKRKSWFDENSWATQKPWSSLKVFWIKTIHLILENIHFRFRSGKSDSHSVSLNIKIMVDTEFAFGFRSIGVSISETIQTIR